MRIFSDFSEFKAAVGSELGISEWIEVTEERISLFAQATCDDQWIHVDQERAKKELPGGITIAHGLLSLSLAPMFIGSGDGREGAAQHIELWCGPYPLSVPRPGRLTIQGPHQHR